MPSSARGFRFVPDPDGIFEASSGDAVKGILTQRAQDAAAEIKKLAPKKRAFFDYRRSVKARAAKRTAGKGYEAAVEVTSPGWHLPEYGTSRIQPTAPIRRGVPLAGLDFREGE